MSAIEDDSMTWNGSSYSGVFTELEKSDSPEIGGFVRRYDASFLVRAELFTGTRPNIDDAVTINSKSLKIVEISEPPDDVVLELKLSAPNGG